MLFAISLKYFTTRSLMRGGNWGDKVSSPVAFVLISSPLVLYFRAFKVFALCSSFRVAAI